MSLFIAGTIAGASLIAGLLVALSEQIRAELCRRREAVGEAQPSSPADRLAGPHRLPAKAAAKKNATVSPESRATAYREILDALGDDLDEDIAEWEAVLQDLPQVIGAEELRAANDRPYEPMVETAQEATAATPLPAGESMTPLHRTRHISADERDMIERLLRTEFAPEEIALWLNLPLERVQEFLRRD
ncbi:MAG: hypothetical protein IAG10_16695 [Planctomycetaceae bacterium]|nr:hypothetical protein [Planctomycetaceae bacterium]